MFITALFIVAPNWKQFKYPLAVNWIKKSLYFHTKEYNHPRFKHYVEQGKSNAKECVLNDKIYVKFKYSPN